MDRNGVLPLAQEFRRKPAEVSFVPTGRVAGPEDVGGERARDDSGDGARHGLLGAEEGPGEG